jgi:hypothetical protein
MVAGSAQAADRCGGIALQGGTIRLGHALDEAWVASPEGRGCLEDLAKEIDRNRLVRAVTVAAYVSDADRANGKGLASAKAVAAALVAAGLPKNRVFALAPAPRPGEPLGVGLRYVERAPDDVAARLAAVGGAAFLGADEASLKPAEPGMPVLVNELVKTGAGGKARIHLKDGSSLELKPESAIRFSALAFSAGGERTVKVEVLQGGIVADVRKATQGSRFEASSRMAVASVRGTSFRFGQDEQGGTRLETLEGRVALAAAATPDVQVEVSAGQGAAVKADGEVLPSRALPSAPKPIGPLQGKLAAGTRCEWSPVGGAARYRVEFARDADFLIEAQALDASESSLAVPALAAGKWFWRVTALDAAGFAGAGSKVYAFQNDR